MRIRKRWMALGALTMALVVAGCAVVGVTVGLEQPRYQVVERLTDAVEVRRYEARTYAESRVPAANPDARRDAFRLLFNYIAGANAGETKIDMTVPVATERPGRKIAMTAPVATETANDQYVMRFFLPAVYDARTAPRPSNPNVSVGTLAPTTEAALRYTGSQSEEKADAMKRTLLRVLADNGYRPEGEPRAMFYNPPFSVPFLRRNEVVVAVETE